MSSSGSTDGHTEQSKANSSVKKGTLHYPFWLGGSSSCFAAGVTHPLDLGEIYTLLLDLSRQRAFI
jgi:dicarboxylate transporter 10